MSRWQLQEAKARLSELIKKAESEGPQEITVHGTPAAVIISHKEYRRLKRPPGSLMKFMRSSPMFGLNLSLERDQTVTREVDVK